MTERPPNRSFPRGALLGAGALVAFALVSAAAGRLWPPPLEPVAQTAESRDLHFEDQPDGGVAVLDARNGGLVARLEPGSNGFARALLRGLARERRREGIGSEPPFRLALRTDGGLVLEDTANQRVVALQAFGPTNAGVFAQLLAAGSEAR